MANELMWAHAGRRYSGGYTPGTSKDGLGYRDSPLLGTIVDATFYRTVTLKEFYSLGLTFTITFQGVRTQDFFYIAKTSESTTNQGLYSSQATFSDNSGAGPSTWTWNQITYGTLAQTASVANDIIFIGPQEA